MRVVNTHWRDFASSQASVGALMEMVPRGPARLTWPLLYRPMHNALIEDALHTAAISLGEPSTRPRWSSWVRVLRKLASMSRRSAPGV